MFEDSEKNFRGLIRAYLVKKSMAHKKHLTFLFLKDSDPISAKSAAQTLYLNLA